MGKANKANKANKTSKVKSSDVEVQVLVPNEMLGAGASLLPEISVTKVISTTAVAAAAGYGLYQLKKISDKLDNNGSN
jgi:hypothetical protein